MKNFTNNFKQFTSRLSARWLIMALMLLVGTSSAWGWDQIKGGMTFYLKPSSDWKQDNAHFAMYLCNGEASPIWVAMTEIAGDPGVFEATVPETNEKYHKNIIFVRLSPKYNVPDWTGKWNQTSDLEYKDSKNYYEGENGTWDSQGADGWKSQKTLYYLMGLTDCGHGDNLSSSVSKNLEVGTHNFKVRDSQGNWYGNNGTMTRNGTSVQSGGWTMETGKNNCKITADVAGNYTFTFNSTTKKLTVTYPDLPCYTLSDVEPGTISSNATNNAICGSGSVTLTLSNTTTKDDLTRTIQWQKYIGNTWSNISNATSTTYTETISATIKYRAKVTWAKSECDDLIEYASEVTITVNPLPSAPALNVPEGKVCAGDLILDDYIADSETNTVNWYKNSDCTEPATNPNLEPSVEETFYAKSKDGNNCISSGYSELTLTSYALPSGFTVTASDNEVCSGEDVTINIEGRENGVDYKLENEVIPAEGITVNPTKNITYSVIASLSECQNMTNTNESQQITVNGTTITLSPEVVHPYEVVTFTAGEQAKWALYTNPSSGSDLSEDNAKYSGKETAYITKGASISTQFKGEAADGYVIRATVGECTTSHTFNVVEDPNNCQ